MIVPSGHTLLQLETDALHVLQELLMTSLQLVLNVSLVQTINLFHCLEQRNQLTVNKLVPKKVMVSILLVYAKLVLLGIVNLIPVTDAFYALLVLIAPVVKINAQTVLSVDLYL